MENLNKHLDEVQNKIGYSFENEDLLLQAFTRSSYSTQHGSENNEVLEFLGDRVLDFYVVKTMADQFGFLKCNSDYYDKDEDLNEYSIVAHKNEADFTTIKQEIVSNKTLARRIDQLGFAKLMYMGDSDIENHVERQEKVKADLFEAILGAVAIDCDWDPDTLQDVVCNMLEIDDFLDDVDTEEERPDRFKFENAVTTLKELAEHGRCSIPEYDLPDEPIHQDGKIWWECTCSVRSWRIKETGYSSSRKDAKRYAAYKVLCKYYNIPNEYEGGDDE